MTDKKLTLSLNAADFTFPSAHFLPERKLATLKHAHPATEISPGN